jgi:hypothetical protein
MAELDAATPSRSFPNANKAQSDPIDESASIPISPTGTAEAAQSTVYVNSGSTSFRATGAEFDMVLDCNDTKAQSIKFPDPSMIKSREMAEEEST